MIFFGVDGGGIRFGKAKLGLKNVLESCGGNLHNSVSFICGNFGFSVKLTSPKLI